METVRESGWHHRVSLDAMLQHGHDVAAPARCPMCGALREQTERTLLDNLTLEEGISALADVAENFGPVALSVLLLRTRYPRLSGREIAARAGLTPATNFRLFKRVLRSNPRLAHIMRGAGVKARGLEGGRKPVRKLEEVDELRR